MLALRQDLSLIESAKADGGSRIWLLQDFVNNRFFKIGYEEVELLSCLRHQELDFQNVEQLIETLKRSLGGKWSDERVTNFLLFLKQNNLLTASGLEARSALMRQREHLQPGVFKKVLRNYLFMRFHVLDPNSILDRIVPLLNFVFSPIFWALIGVNTLVGLYLTSRQFDYFLSSFVGYLNFEGLLIAGIAIAFAKVLHELGHAIVARKLGCSVNSMGFALLIFWPVLFTDTTDSWRLKSHRQRALIGAAGVIVELALASVCLTLWNLVDEGYLKSALFVLATTTWILTLAINLNPLMRFDGYFVLSDILKVENLQGRSFALANWQLREWLFGFSLEPPEKPRIGLVIFAFATWVYRFFLFLGIALIIYNYFFKLLGIVLVSLQLFNSLVKPIFKELKFWWQHKSHARLWPNTVLSFGALLLLLAWLVVPSDRTLTLPAFWQSADTKVFFLQQPGLLVGYINEDGRGVQQGDVLATFSFPDVEFQLGQLNRDKTLLQAQLAGSGVSSSGLQSRATLAAQLQATLGRIKELEGMLDEQSIIAPFDGVIRSINTELSINQWIAPGEALFTLVNPNHQEIVAFLSEQDFTNIQLGDLGRYYSDGGQLTPVWSELMRIDSFPVDTLEQLYVASNYGGDLPVRDSANGTLIPQSSTYRLYFEPQGELPVRISRGSMKVRIESSAPIWRYLRNITNLWRRESGF
jgi:putative peptide zinc metalloprotease protein